MLSTQSCRKKQHRKRAPVVEPLAPRVLYSADPLGLSSDLLLSEGSTTDVEAEFSSLLKDRTVLSAINDELLSQELSNSNDQTRKEVIFVNTSVTDYQQIADALIQSSDESVDYVIHTLSITQSIADVNQTLTQYQLLDTIHFITHGNDATFSLGSSIVTNENATSHTDSFEQWGAALAEHGDILLYGCNLAKTSEGQQLVASIAAATNADVGASDNRTGHETLNADWRLEFAVGQIATDSSRMETILNDWESQLASITVGTTADIVDAPDLGSINGLIDNPGADGEISLREAIIAANADSGEVDTIHLPNLPTGPYTLDKTIPTQEGDQYYGDLDITAPIAIIGESGTTINGNDSDRIFDISNTPLEVTLSNLHITNGSTTEFGGGILAENVTSLQLLDVEITENEATQGGGLYINKADVQASRVLVNDNEATNQGGGLYLEFATFTGYDIQFIQNNLNTPAIVGGGAYITADATLNLHQSRFIANSAAGGAGVYTLGEFRAFDTTFSGNMAAFGGGAITNLGDTYINRSLFLGNTADRGTGLLTTQSGNSWVFDSTFSQNSAITSGSSILSEANGHVTVFRSTFADNVSSNSFDDQTVSVHSATGGTMEIQGSLFARNATPVTGYTFDRAIVSLGNNITDGTLTAAQKHPTDRSLVADTGLSVSVGANGGNVASYTLLAGSIAINAGTTLPTNNSTSVTDTTGFIRQGNSDVGAYEFRQTTDAEGPAVTKNEGIELSFGDKLTIRYDDLFAIDPDSTDNSQIKYNVVAVPSNGQLLINNIAVGVGDTFTQQDIHNQNISYSNTSAGGTDSFTFFVSDKDDNVSRQYDFEITILGSTNIAPVLDNSSTFILPSQSPADTNPTGTSVSDLLLSVREDAITDVNTGALEGIAITEVDNANGIWEYKADPADTTWSQIQPASSTGLWDGNSLLLAPDSLVRFIPTPDSGYTGQATFHFRANDWTLSTHVGNYHLDNYPQLGLIGPNGALSEDRGITEVDVYTPLDLTTTSPIDVVTKEDEEFIFNLSQLSIDDSEDHELLVLLEAENGTLSLAGTSNLVVLGDGTSSISAIGLHGDINNALDGLIYTPDNHFNGTDNLTVESSRFTDRELSYSFDNLNTTGATDENFGTSNNGILVGNADTSGPFLTLDGDKDALEINSDLGITDALSFATWVQFYPTPENGNLHQLFSLNETVSLRYDADTNALSGLYTTPTVDFETLAFFDLDDSAIHHVAYTIDTINNRQIIYVDGIPVAQTTHTAGIPFDSSTPTARIGALGNTYAHSLNGKIDDVQIFSEALSAAQVAAIHAHEDVVEDTVVITVTPVNDEPALSTIDTLPALYTEGDAPVGITGNLSLTDIDDTNIESATVSIIGNFTAGEDRLVFTDQLGITGTYDPASGVLSLSGSASIPEYQTALGTIAYNNTSSNLSTLARTVSFETNDGDDNSNVLTRDIQLTAVNNTPIIDLNGVALAGTDLAKIYTEDDPPIRLSNLGFVNDIGENDIVTLTIDAVGIGTTGSLETLYLPGQPIVAGTSFADSTTLFSGATAVINYDGAETIVLTSMPNETLLSTDLLRFIRAISYQTTSDNPIDGDIEFQFTAQDSGGLQSATATSTMTVVPVNDAPMLSTIETMPAVYIEGGNPASITDNLSLTDADDTYIEFATVSITSGLSSVEDELVFTDKVNISGSYDPGNGILSLTGSALIADYETALHSVKYNNTSGNPSNLTRTVSFDINDGDDPSNALTRDINFTVVNDAPVLADTEVVPATYTENDTPIIISGATTVSDVDDINIESATISIIGGFVSSEDKLEFANQAAITGTFDSINGTLALSGSTSLADYQSAIQSITYQNTSDDPSDQTRTLSVEINDGDDDSNITTRDIDITAVNDPPKLATVEAAPALYIEGRAPAGITGNLSLSDLDDTHIESATVSIINGFSFGEDELTFTDQLNITGSYNPRNGILTLAGTAPIADYQSAIRTVAYNNTSDNPSTLTRTVSFDINDGDDPSNALSRDIDFSAVNDPPVLAGTEITPATYTENDTAIVISGTTNISEVDDTNIESATVSIVSGFASSEDELGFANQSTITGSFDSTTGILSLTGSASLADYQAAIQSITYKNTSHDPSDQTRTVSFQINDGDDNSNVTSRDIDFTAVNDAPTLTTIEALPAFYTEGRASVGITGNLSLADIDDTHIESATVFITPGFSTGEDKLEFTDQLNITGSYDPNTGVLTLSGTAPVSDYETALHTVKYNNTSGNPSTLTRTVSLYISDGEVASNVLSRDIDFTAVNDPPVLAGTEITPAKYTENDTPIVISGTTTISDVDNINIESATVSINNGFVSSEDELGLANQNFITGTFDSTTGILSLTGSASLANYQAAIQSITYKNTSDDPSDQTRTVSIQINDGDDNSNVTSRDIDFTAVNDAPELTTIEATAALYTEGGAPAEITGNLSLTDIDDVNIEYASISITNGFSDGEDELAFTDHLNIAGLYDPSSGVLTLTGSASVDDYQSAIRTVAYNNTSDNPSSLTRTVIFIANDGQATSNTISRDIDFKAVNDAPILATNEAANASYTEGEAPISISTNISLTDIDDTEIESATISITSGFSTGEDELAFTDQPGITGSFNQSNGILTLNGSASLADYESALRTVVYNNTSNNPSTLTRTVSFTINDGDEKSNTLSRDIDFTALNNQPILTGTEANSATYTENDAPITITDTTTVSDVDDTNIEAATVAIMVNLVSSEDLLNFTDQLGISGIYDATTGILSLSGSASLADYQMAIQSVTYENTSNEPSDLTRTVSVDIFDGDSNSNTKTRNIDLTAINDAPTLTNIETLPATYFENGLPVSIIGTLQLTDIDNTNIDSATISITGNHVPLEDQLSTVLDSTFGITASFDSATGALTLSGSSSIANYHAALQAVTYQNLSSNPTAADRTVTMTVNDGDLDSTPVSRNIQIVPANNAPQIPSLEQTPLQFTEGDASLVTTTDIDIADIDNPTLISATVAIANNYVADEDALVVDNALLNSLYGIHANFDTSSGTLFLTGNASTTDYQEALRSISYSNNSENPSDATRTISYTVSDGIMDSTTRSRALEVLPVNDAPVTANMRITTAEDTAVVISFSDLPFSDTENHSPLEIIVDTTNSRLTVDNTAQTVTYTPSVNYNGPDSFIFEIRDEGGTANTGSDTSAPAVIDITVVPVNDPPLTTTISLPATLEDSTPSGQYISTLVDQAFSDADYTDSLVGIAVTGSPDSPANGRWQYALPDGIWQNIDNSLSSLSETNALVLSNDTALRFLPAADYNGIPLPLTYKAIDSSYTSSFSTDVQQITQNTNTPGTDGHFSNSAEILTQINPINDAPIIDNIELPQQLEDTNASAPMQIIDLFSAQYSDTDGTAELSGIAVTHNPAIATEGNWQFSTNSSDWHNIDFVSDTDSLLLGSDSYIRFSTASNYHGKPEDLAVRAVDGTFTGTFTIDDTSREKLDTTNTASNMVSAEHTISITIVPVNDAPEGSSATIDTLEDTDYIFGADDFGFFDPLDTDAFSGITIQSQPINGTLLLSGSQVSIGDWITTTDLDVGNFTYAPTANSNNQDFWEFAVSDNGGIDNNGTDQDQTNDTITINILPVNDAPSGVSSTLATNESTPIVFSRIDFGFTDTVEQNNLKSVLIVSLPASGALLIDGSQVTQNSLIDASEIASGLLTFVPAPLVVASVAEFDFKIIDDGGTDNNGEDTAATANKITINITTDNNPPMGRDNTIELYEDSNIVLDVTMFGFSDEIDNHVMAGVLFSTAPTSGTLLNNGSPVDNNTIIDITDINNNQLTYTPVQNESGVNYTSMQFKVIDTGIDASGKNISTEGNTLTINVIPVNDAPILNVENRLELTENTASKSIGNVTVTDADINDTHEFSVNDDRFEIVDGALALKPDITLDFEGEPQIALQITVTDNTGASTTQNVDLQISNINEAPQSGTVTNRAHTAPFSFAIPETLFTDVDGDSLTTTATLTDGSTLPEWLIFENGTFSIADNAPAGPINVIVIAADPDGLTATSQLTINVQEAEPIMAEAMAADLPTFTSAETITVITEESAEPEVITENTDTRTVRERAGPLEELFVAEKIQTSESIQAQQRLSEVIQLDTLNIINPSMLNTEDDTGFALANEFSVLLTQSAFEAQQTKQQDAINVIALKKLANVADKHQEQIANSRIMSPTVVATSVTLSSSVSVGYILWLLRGGTLLASVMASMPAWRAIDPLPVLEGLSGDDDDDTETLESMVEETDQKDPTTPQDTIEKAA